MGGLRAYDPAEVRAALGAQAEALRAAVRALCADPRAGELLGRATRLGDWNVRELVAHIGIVVDWVSHRMDDPVPEGEPVALVAWAGLTRTAAPVVEADAREHAAGVFAGEPASVASAFDAAVDGLLRALARPEAAELGRLFAMRFGPILLSDFLVTRLVETVVHADDLADALGLGFPHDRFALASVTRLLADAFADRGPDAAAELRVPPYATVPAPGPSTPPSVVETDPLTWVRLATGRLGWSEAVASGAVSARGERSDLSTWLPILG
ncbi:sterol carrier family protein [Streptomyces sp. UNOC14_S4]|uniref:sterol carrier family protein n=1 Tax=Streptomyces sp. UNOC14_S4 TaxID=2872340 RepID=UPI001E50AAFE|nr:sterol carrier family protein [Streptomyces sp. UNOC14_S4]MCC3767877.1 maleylpyruvate isomerase family mycothiol-dependent enzyme [Streptomyces sp. UNOC14_S4]